MIEEPDQTRQFDPVPCPDCGALEIEDCQCPKTETNLTGANRKQ